ncbi:MAG: indolepyruvate ferredoxin oxidoreductase subunit alpha [Hyphomicrobiales bacterium]|nr:indolepyruvate ferredoxin oxidoreductase subunit alpha [Hyphomicrobiales bacterium]
MDQLVDTGVERKTKPSKSYPMMGNEAIARGVWEAGARVCAAYPGTPSTEIMENLATYPREDLVAEWATNEKTALDIAIGASFSGVRAFAAMKHVGLNVASDSLMSQSYIGVNGALVLAVCDDPGIHSSQNEQDTRLFAKFAGVPILEPSDAQEALDFTRKAFDISEEFDTPVIVRSSTRLSHTRSVVCQGNRTEVEAREFNNDIAKNVMIPAHARSRHPKVLQREGHVIEYLNKSDLNKVRKSSKKFGVITVGLVATYVEEVLPDASILKLASSFPLATDLVADFMKSVEQVVVVEELEPVIEDQLKVLGYKIEGKKYFSRDGEHSPATIRLGLEQCGFIESSGKSQPLSAEAIARPPLLCAGCPHITSYMALNGVNARVAGDIGCYTLAAIEPLHAIHTTVAMGCSIANAIGMAQSGNETRPVVATIGDSTFLHSGIPPLIDAVYSNANITVLLLDNHITAMTGGQDHAATGRSLRGEDTTRIVFADLCRTLGVKWVREVDSYDVGTLFRTVREATEYRGVSVVISNRPCVLDPTKIRGEPVEVRTEKCTGCQSCMNLGCPAITWDEEMYDGQHKVTIDPTKCIGCSICTQVCPVDGIRPVKNS